MSTGSHGGHEGVERKSAGDVPARSR
jgi:hypothetical protein